MEKIASNQITDVKIEDLISYSDHPFHAYEGKKLDELVESIRAQGIITPLVARPHLEHDGKFEVLAGHNRRIAAEKLELSKVPVIIRYDLKGKDNEAMLVVIETNLIQRSFKDLSYSERAKAIFMYHEAIKKQGRRSDLINEALKTSRQVGEMLASDEETGRNFDLSPRTVSRYLQIHRLSKPLLDRLDDGDFALDPAINASYLKPAEQKHLDSLLGDSKSNCELTMKNAQALRKASAKSSKALSKAAIEEIIGKGVKIKKGAVVSPQEETSPMIKALTELTKTVIPGIVSDYLDIGIPTEEDNKKLIESLRNALEAAIAELTI